MRITSAPLLSSCLALMLSSCTLSRPLTGLVTGGADLCTRVWDEDCSPPAKLATAVPLWLVGTTVGTLQGLADGTYTDIAFLCGSDDYYYDTFPFHKGERSSDCPTTLPAGNYPVYIDGQGLAGCSVPADSSFQDESLERSALADPRIAAHLKQFGGFSRSWIEDGNLHFESVRHDAAEEQKKQAEKNAEQAAITEHKKWLEKLRDSAGPLRTWQVYSGDKFSDAIAIPEGLTGSDREAWVQAKLWNPQNSHLIFRDKERIIMIP